MTTLYNQRMTLIVPEGLIPQANQLALIAGESALDVETFGIADYYDVTGNNYAVCSSVIKPIVLTLLDIKLADLELPSHAISANVSAAQEIMDKLVFYATGVEPSPEIVIITLEKEPMTILDELGLMRFFEDIDDSI